jgi:hypothetical protein
VTNGVSGESSFFASAESLHLTRGWSTFFRKYF